MIGLFYYLCLGFARQCDDTANDGLGSLKTLVGTPTYLSPEIARRSPHYGSKTDMWSFGVILYVLIAGFPPFSDNEQHALFRKICKCEYKFHKQYFGHVSMEVKNLISSFLEVDPKKRFSAREALNSAWICSDDSTFMKTDPFCGGFGLSIFFR